MIHGDKMVVEQQSLKFETKRGRQVMARPLISTDAPYLVNIFENMSAESRYRRFQQSLENPSPKLIWTEAENIAQKDTTKQGGFIAFCQRPLHNDIPVASARYILIDENSAEIAMSVIDEMQGQGVGNWLLQLTVSQAQQQGLKTLVGTALNDNDAVWHLLDNLPYPYKRTPDGLTADIKIDLTAI
jgi:acetyltransferase